MLELKLQFFAEVGEDEPVKEPTPQTEGKVFTQEELDAIVQKRIAKERSKFEKEQQALIQNAPEVVEEPKEEEDETLTLVQKLQKEVEEMREQNKNSKEREALLNLGIPKEKISVMQKMKSVLSEEEFNEQIAVYNSKNTKTPDQNKTKNSSGDLSFLSQYQGIN